MDVIGKESLMERVCRVELALRLGIRERVLAAGDTRI